jgi:hypothetical protein
MTLPTPSKPEPAGDAFATAFSICAQPANPAAIATIANELRTDFIDLMFLSLQVISLCRLGVEARVLTRSCQSGSDCG